MRNKKTARRVSHQTRGMRSHPPPVLEGTSPTAKSEASLGSPSGPLSLRGDDTASSLGSPGERGWDTSFNSSDSSPRLLGGRSNGYGPGDARAPPRASAFRETRARASPEDAARATRLARARDDSLDGPSTPSPPSDCAIATTPSSAATVIPTPRAPPPRRRHVHRPRRLHPRLRHAPRRRRLRRRARPPSRPRRPRPVRVQPRAG